MSSAPPPGKKQGKPYIAHCEPGKYAYCQCQRSSRFPYCDGTHRDAEDGVGPIKTVFEGPVTVAWCACGKSRGKPFCDGSHEDLGGGEAS